jgi:glucosylceramidase
MKKGFLIAGLVCFSASVFSQSRTAKKVLPYSAANKTVKVYVTEKGSNKRLFPAGELKFETEAQPPETETVVFVDPAQKFQTMLGIGGALNRCGCRNILQTAKR